MPKLNPNRLVQSVPVALQAKPQVESVLDSGSARGPGQHTHTAGNRMASGIHKPTGGDSIPAVSCADGTVRDRR